MPVRATARGAARTALDLDADVLVCGASFAGLAAARELAGCGAQVVVVDRYDIGERQTSACAAPTAWLEALGLEASIRQTFGSMLVHAPRGTWRWELPWTWSTFDYRSLCSLLASQGEFRFETAKVSGVSRGAVHRVDTDRGELRAPLVLDALGWRRVLASPGLAPVQPPDERMSRGLEVHPSGRGEELELFLDASLARAGYGWSFPAGDEVRVGVGSFRPRDGVREPTEALADQLDLAADGWQGNWIPHRRREPVDDGIAFAGDSAGHCMATSAEGIRTAFFFGLAAGRALASAHVGALTRDEALRRYAVFVRRRHWKLEGLWHLQTAVSGLLRSERAISAMTAAVARRPVTRWCFEHYGRVTPVGFVDG